MRGKAISGVPGGGTFGITPAHAGKRFRATYGKRAYGDHPRACGEKSVGRVGDGMGAGSPPRMRGKVSNKRPSCDCPGITPAHAGKRICSARTLPTAWDHPRACGEKLTCIAMFMSSPGSPPRMRGKELEALREKLAGGITPAHAGKRRCGCTRYHAARDHPRACGEKLHCLCCRLPLSGSPPRMRGKVIAVCLTCLLVGITPAHAGKRNLMSDGRRL